MLRDLLKIWQCSPTGIQTAGLPLQLHGRHVTIFAKVGSLLADGDGLRMALEWMGSGGLKPCFRHWNVLSKNSGRVQHGSGDKYVEIDCPDPRKFRCWTQGELNAAIDVCVTAHE